MFAGDRALPIQGQDRQALLCRYLSAELRRTYSGARSAPGAKAHARPFARRNDCHRCGCFCRNLERTARILWTIAGGEAASRELDTTRGIPLLCRDPTVSSQATQLRVYGWELREGLTHNPRPFPTIPTLPSFPNHFPRWPKLPVSRRRLW